MFRRRALFVGKEAIGAYHGVQAEVAELMERLLLAGEVFFVGNPSPWLSNGRRRGVLHAPLHEKQRERVLGVRLDMVERVGVVSGAGTHGNRRKSDETAAVLRNFSDELAAAWRLFDVVVRGEIGRSSRAVYRTKNGRQ